MTYALGETLAGDSEIMTNITDEDPRNSWVAHLFRMVPEEVSHGGKTGESSPVSELLGDARQLVEKITSTVAVSVEVRLMLINACTAFAAAQRSQSDCSVDRTLKLAFDSLRMVNDRGLHWRILSAQLAAAPPHVRSRYEPVLESAGSFADLLTVTRMILHPWKWVILPPGRPPLSFILGAEQFTWTKLEEMHGLDVSDFAQIKRELEPFRLLILLLAQAFAQDIAVALSAETVRGILTKIGSRLVNDTGGTTPSIIEAIENVLHLLPESAPAYDRGEALRQFAFRSFGGQLRLDSDTGQLPEDQLVRLEQAFAQDRLQEELAVLPVRKELKRGISRLAIETHELAKQTTMARLA